MIRDAFTILPPIIAEAIAVCFLCLMIVIIIAAVA